MKMNPLSVAIAVSDIDKINRVNKVIDTSSKEKKGVNCVHQSCLWMKINNRPLFFFFSFSHAQLFRLRRLPCSMQRITVINTTQYSTYLFDGYNQTRERERRKLIYNDQITS